MDRKTVLRLARQADGKTDGERPSLYLQPAWMERFAALVAAHEREECAKVCDDADARFMRRSEGRLMTETGADAYRSASSGALQCALAIRARGKA